MAPAGYFVDYGFGVYDGQRATWADASGYLPEQVTSFATSSGATIRITEFADRVTLGGNPFVAVYARVRVVNPTAHPLTIDPQASAALVPLDDAPNASPPHHAVDHDYAIVERPLRQPPLPGRATTSSPTAGGFDQHEAHMRAFWDAQLAGIAQVSGRTPASTTPTRAASSRPSSPAAGTNSIPA